MTVVPVSTTSLFGVSGVAVSYCLTGSGTGKNILVGGVANDNVQNACPTSTSGGVTLSGFGAPAVSRTDLTQPNFVGADVPMSATDFSNYINVHDDNNPVEFPAVVGAIAIAFNLTDNLDNPVTSSEVNFSDAQLCLIFSGQASNWDDARLASAFTLPAAHSIPSAPINVQYRLDGSGTTFAFSNHLATACNTTANPLEASQTFFTTTAGTTYMVQNFFTGAGGLPNGDGTFTPKWTGFSGDAALADAILWTNNSIGYVETANALAIDPSLQLANVDGTSPTANFNSTLELRLLSIAFNSAIDPTNNSNGTATIEALTNSVHPLPTGSNACIVLVKPSDYAVPGNNVLGFINPVGNYPIVAVSYLLGNSVGNGADLANTRTLVTSPYNTSIRSTVTTIGGSTGLQYLDTTTKSVFSTSQVSGCYGS